MSPINEENTKLRYITPALQRAGWDPARSSSRSRAAASRSFRPSLIILRCIDFEAECLVVHDLLEDAHLVDIPQRLSAPLLAQNIVNKSYINNKKD